MRISDRLHALLALHWMIVLYMMLVGTHVHPELCGQETNSYRVSNAGPQNSGLSRNQNVSWIP